jgi:thiol-disulfide isomerase/thioredoxin
VKHIVLAVIYFSLGAVALAAPAGPDVGTIAPSFKARNILTGDKIALDEQRGKLVILTFWATWCPPCRRELPILEKAQRLVGKDRLVVLAVVYRDTPEAIWSLKKAAKDWQITLLDDWGGSIASSYKISAIPHLFMIDQDGKIVANHTGYGDKSLEVLVEDINGALRGSAASGSTATPGDRSVTSGADPSIPPSP